MLHMHEWMFLCAQTPHGYLVLYLEVYYMNVNVVKEVLKNGILMYGEKFMCLQGVVLWN